MKCWSNFSEKLWNCHQTLAEVRQQKHRTFLHWQSQIPSLFNQKPEVGDIEKGILFIYLFSYSLASLQKVPVSVSENAHK